MKTKAAFLEQARMSPSLRGIPADQLEMLAQYLYSGELARTQRISALRYAAESGLSDHEATRLFLSLTRAGFLGMEWNVVCPLCGGVEGHTHLSGINKPQGYCFLCDKPVEMDLGSHVEIVFSLMPDWLPGKFSPFSDRQSYETFYFSKSLKRPIQVQNYINQSVKGWVSLPPGETKKLRFPRLSAGNRYRLVSLDRLFSVNLNVQDLPEAADPVIIDAEIGAEGFVPAEISAAPGSLAINIRNLLPAPTAFIVSKVDAPTAARVFAEYPNEFHPFLTGTRLLNSQSFRDLFRIEDLPENLHLKAGSVTILFTDLKGSTELYERTGDMKAYSLVREHFDLLKAEVDRFDGALIKTIGDAVMAAFNTPRDAVQASVAMVEAIRTMNLRTSAEGHEIAIKLGLHAGEAIAVNANERLDYFGQTVNVAARIQGLAAGNEIWLSEAVQSDLNCQAILRDAGYHLERQLAELKGVKRAVPVYQCIAPSGGGRTASA